MLSFGKVLPITPAKGGLDNWRFRRYEIHIIRKNHK